MKKRVLLKLGGSSLDSSLTLKEVAGVIRGYTHKGYDVAIIHGAGHGIKEEIQSRGLELQYVDGIRQMTPEMMEVVSGIMDKVHDQVLSNLQEGGFEVVSLSGARNQVFQCKALQEELQQVGEIQSVNAETMINAWEHGKIPVVTSIGAGKNNDLFSINPDWAATELAVELHADALVFLTDQEGVIGPDHKRLREVHIFDVQKMIEDGTVSGGMSTKVQTMLHGFKNGVKEIRVLNSFKASEMHEVPSMGTRMTL